MRAPKATSARKGAHSGERETAEAVVGSSGQAAAQRRRAQKGVAATARRGEAAVLGHVKKSGKVSKAVQKEVTRAMKNGTQPLRYFPVYDARRELLLRKLHSRPRPAAAPHATAGALPTAPSQDPALPGLQATKYQRDVPSRP